MTGRPNDRTPCAHGSDKKQKLTCVGIVSLWRMFRKDHAGSASTAQRVAPGAESSEANSGEEKLSGEN